MAIAPSGTLFLLPVGESGVPAGEILTGVGREMGSLRLLRRLTLISRYPTY